jgi:hypothetical protein
MGDGCLLRSGIGKREPHHTQIAGKEEGCIGEHSCTLYGTRRSVIEFPVWLSNLLVLGAPRLSPLTIAKHANELNAPTATVQSRCLQDPPTICRRRCLCRRKTWKTRSPLVFSLRLPRCSRKARCHYSGWQEYACICISPGSLSLLLT